MKLFHRFHSRLFLLVVSLMYLYFGSSTIIIRSRNAMLHFTERMENTHSKDDVLPTFGLRSRQNLCDIVIAAAHFSSPLKNKKRDHSVINYQRNAPSMKLSSDPYYLKYRPYSVLLFNEPVILNAIPCVKTGNVKWWITFGKVDKFMYLLESSLSRHRKLHLKITAIIEPNSVIISSETQEQMLWFLTDQVISDQRSKMESICKLDFYDKLRLCSSVFKALNIMGYLQNDNDVVQVNYIRVYQRCKREQVKMSHSLHSISRSLRVQPCSIIENGEVLGIQFYILADAQEHGSIFVLFPEDEQELLIVKAHIMKVGALLNPFKK